MIYDALPNELPRVAGIITSVPQTPLSHVNLRALQDGVPNAYVADVGDGSDIAALVDSHVYFAVNDSGYTIRAATQAEVDKHFASVRPTETTVPERDLSVTEITPLSEVGFDDWDAFGVKAANVAVLGTLGFPAGTVPDGFAVPFYFYDEFMTHNGLYDDIEEMLADPDFASDYDTKADELKKLRKKIKKADTPAWIDAALEAMHATYPEGASLRYRSSTNNEDLPNFNGAGLYDSKTQHPDETEEDGIAKSLKQVYASLWNFRAFIERDFYRIDHTAAAMGVLVHPNYTDETVNGVAVSFDPAYNTDGTHYVNSQVGEDLVTNPEANSVPEEVLLRSDGTYTVAALSNQVSPGELLMTDDQYAQLRRHLDVIHDTFADLYGAQGDEQFAMEIEFKITSDNTLAIKQARPWIFADTAPESHEGGEDQPAALTASFVDIPANNEGLGFVFRVLFSEPVDVKFQEFRDYGFEIRGGTVTRARRVDRRDDLWEITVVPDSFGAVELVLPRNRPCATPGAICSLDGRKRLSATLAHTLESYLPRVPDGLVASFSKAETVLLDWDNSRRAASYDVQFRTAGQWQNLPHGGTEIEFDGSSAVVSRLPEGDIVDFRVRGRNPFGWSQWSDHVSYRPSVAWESELTAGRITTVSPAMAGYSTHGDLDGHLAPDSFEFDGTTYHVKILARYGQGLWLGLSSPLPIDFTLRLGDAVYLASRSKVPHTASGAAGYWWPAADPEWQPGERVPVELTLIADTPLGDRPKAPVTGYFNFIPPDHDGQTDFWFRIYFSEGITATAENMRQHVLTVGNGVAAVEPVDTDGRIWKVAITPQSKSRVTVGIDPASNCELPAAVCTDDGRPLLHRMQLIVGKAENTAASGLPAIRGTALEGETVTADITGIADADGLAIAEFQYQWLADDGYGQQEIPGATNPTYVLAPADVSRELSVRVSFEDDAGYPETLTSAPITVDHTGRPHSLVATPADGAVRLTWHLFADSPDWTSFQILRYHPESGQTEPLVHTRHTMSADTAFTDTDVLPGVLYVYRVRGENFYGESSPLSAPAQIRLTE